jgi:UDP:flavonoid glycosyltransferase YjiC (YdhE family)
VREAGARALVASTVHDLGDLGDPDDVLVESLLPSHRIMPRVDVAVIAGGQGSVQTAMTSGVPFVGVPLQPEQELNVAEMVRHGAALRIAPDAAGTEAMTHAVRAVLADGRTREAARRVQRLYAGADSAAASAEAILDLVGRG